MVDGQENLRHALAMLVRVILSLHRAMLLATLFVALVATGFAHRMPTPQDEALAFALANGASLADICGDSGGDDHRGGECLACQISGSADLPPAAQTLIGAQDLPAFPTSASHVGGRASCRASPAVPIVPIAGRAALACAR